MAKIVVTGTYWTLATVDYSAQVRSAGLTLNGPEVDVTNMGSAGWREFLSGVKAGQLDVDLVKDNDLSVLDSAVWTNFSAGTATAFTLQQTSGAKSTSNPSYEGSVIITTWQPIMGAVGGAFGGSISWPTTGAITRDTTP